jgi:hypothetical protein
MNFVILSDRSLYTNPKADFVYSKRIYDTSIVDTKKLRKNFLGPFYVPERRMVKISPRSTEEEGLIFDLKFAGGIAAPDAICDLEIRHATNIKRVELRSNSVTLFSKTNPERQHTLKLDAIGEDDCLIVRHHFTCFCELTLFAEYYEKPNPLKVLNFSFFPLGIRHDQADEKLADLTALIGDGGMREALSIITRYLFQGLQFFTRLPDGNFIIYANGFLGLGESNEGYEPYVIGGMMRETTLYEVEWVIEILHIGYCYLQDLPVSLESLKSLIEKRKLSVPEPSSA